MGCELCGYEGPLFDSVVEGALLKICKKCSGFGNAIPLTRTIAASPRQRTLAIEEKEPVLVPDYSEQIKKARETLGLKQGDLAEKIHEKESVIQHIESHNLHPSLALAHKLERFLHITLFESPDQPQKSKININDPLLTIGDLINIKKKTP